MRTVRYYKLLRASLWLWRAWRSEDTEARLYRRRSPGGRWHQLTGSAASLPASFTAPVIEVVADLVGSGCFTVLLQSGELWRTVDAGDRWRRVASLGHQLQRLRGAIAVEPS